MDFILGCIPPQKEEKNPLLFLFQQGSLLVKRLNEGYTVPVLGEAGDLEKSIGEKFYIGSLDGHSCYTASLPKGAVIPQGFECLGLRQIYGQIDEGIMKAAFRAVQIVTWDETFRFCGVCGHATVKKPDEFAKVCPRCGHLSYPRISPAVIVAVTKGDKLLLARNKNFTSSFYSVLAGFVEAGETLEECVKREIREEVGIEVKNIRYFGSQPWPFPHSLMLAFTAEYESGEVKADGVELIEAGWYGVDEIPEIPGKISVSRKLIDWFIEKNSK